jgi:GntR family transcriptional regulator
MDLTVDTSRAAPPSRQLVEGVLDGLAGGVIAPGERLPSVRGLAAEALVNPNTVGKAYRELEALGVVEGRAGAGVFVTEAGPGIARRKRRGATLVDVRRALKVALQAGHDPEDLVREVEQVLALRAPVNGDTR